MNDLTDLERELLQRADCLHTLFAWQCWCPTCTHNILADYRLEALQPASVVETIRSAEARAAAAGKEE